LATATVRIITHGTACACKLGSAMAGPQVQAQQFASLSAAGDGAVWS
jgi:hypothetical protein